MRLSLLDTIYLRWASQGKSLTEIAVIEGEDPSDIEYYLRRAAIMLGARSLPDAIAKATTRKII